MFENIECEWPLFYSYLILFHLFQGEKVAVSTYAQKLEVGNQFCTTVKDGLTFNFIICRKSLCAAMMECY